MLRVLMMMMVAISTVSVRAATVSTAVGRGADACVMQAAPGTAYGAQKWVWLRGSAWSYNVTGYLRFDLADLLQPGERFESATLYFYQYEAITLYQMIHFIGLPDGCPEDLEDGWSEATITWNTRLTTEGPLLGWMDTYNGIVKENTPGWISFSSPELVDFLNADTNGLVTIQLKRADDKAQSYTKFWSKENGELIPYLEYTVTTAPVEPIVHPGDVNGDGVVSFEDFAILQNHYGQSVTGDTWSQGDLNDDGYVTFADFSILQNHYGQSAPEAAAGVTAAAGAPCGMLAPALLALLGLAFLGLGRMD